MAGLSRDAEWGIASEAIEKASQAVVAKFTSENYLDKFSVGGVAGGTEGKIIKVEGNQAWINMGAMSGLKVGDKFDIYSVGEALVDRELVTMESSVRQISTRLVGEVRANKRDVYV